MPIIRKKLVASEVYPETLRYDEGTDTVQSFIDGEWKNNPDADPRKQTTLPPRITSDPACDAGRSIADALKTQIDQTIVAIGNAATAFTIAGIILSLFSFGLFAVFISIALTIADAMIGVGASGLTAALTPTVYDQLACIINCYMNGSGRLVANGLTSIQTDVDDQIGGVAATVINSMLSLAGEGGINNLASLGTATGDCDDCDCPCGFLTNAGVGNWQFWTLLETNLDPTNFPNPITLVFLPVNNHPAPPGTTAATSTPTGFTGAIGMQTVFEHPCYITTLFVDTSGGEGNVARMVAGYRSGGVWTVIANVVRNPWGSGQTFTVNQYCDAIGFQFVSAAISVVAIDIN